MISVISTNYMWNLRSIGWWEGGERGGRRVELICDDKTCSTGDYECERDRERECSRILCGIIMCTRGRSLSRIGGERERKRENRARNLGVKGQWPLWSANKWHKIGLFFPTLALLRRVICVKCGGVRGTPGQFFFNSPTDSFFYRRRGPGREGNKFITNTTISVTI